MIVKYFTLETFTSMSLRSCFLLNVLLLVPSPASAAGPVRCGLWLDPSRVALSDPATVQLILEQPVDRIVVPVLRGGWTLYPTRSTIFKQLPRCKDGPDPLASLLARARGQSKKVYAHVDCLQWSLPGTPEVDDLLLRFPELAERNRGEECGQPLDGKYASPFQPRVRECLAELVGEIALRYPELDGLLLECRLSETALLGFSKGTRAAYIRVRQRDPLDVVRAGGSPEDQKAYMEWSDWRKAQVGTLIQELRAQFRVRNKKAAIATVGDPLWYRRGFVFQHASLEDWLGWAVNGSIDEVAFRCRWYDPANKDAYAAAKSLFARLPRPIQPTVMLALRDNQNVLDPNAALATLQGQDISSVLLLVEDEKDLARVGAVCKSIAEARPTSPEASRPLSEDPALAGSLTLDLVNPTIGKVLQHLERATGRTFLVEPTSAGDKTAAGSYSFRNVPARVVMDRLATSVKGVWEATESGYRLQVPSSDGSGDDGETPSSWRLVVVLVSFGVLLAGSSLFAWRSFRRRRGTPGSPRAAPSAQGHRGLVREDVAAVSPAPSAAETASNSPSPGKSSAASPAPTTEDAHDTP